MPYVVRLNQETLDKDNKLIDFFFKEDGSLTNDVRAAKKFRTNTLAMEYIATLNLNTKIEEVQCS